MGNPAGPNKGGRPLGSLSKLSQKIIAKAEANGDEMPHEFLMRIARGLPIEVYKFDPNSGKILGQTYELPDMEARKDAAKAAAPYFAPKLSTVETIGAVSNEQLDEIIERAAAEAGISFGTHGEGETPEALHAPRERRSARGQLDDAPGVH